MKKAFMCGMSLAVVVALGGLAAADDWKTHKSAAGHYSALFPGTPREATQRAETGLDVHIAKLEHNDVAYVVEVASVPKDVLAKQQPEQFLDNAEKNALERSKGKLVSKRDITTADGHAGREIVVDAPRGVEMTLHAFLVGERLYQVLVVVRKGKGAPEDATRFLGSFTLQP
jgi:hypothetical protein